MDFSISSLIPRGHRLSEKGIKVNKELQENCAAENFPLIFHKNINSKLDLFLDKLHPNKKVKVFLMYILENLSMNMFDVFTKR